MSNVPGDRAAWGMALLQHQGERRCAGGREARRFLKAVREGLTVEVAWGQGGQSVPREPEGCEEASGAERSEPWQRGGYTGGRPGPDTQGLGGPGEAAGFYAA